MAKAVELAVCFFSYMLKIHVCVCISVCACVRLCVCVCVCGDSKWLYKESLRVSFVQSPRGKRATQLSDISQVMSSRAP